MTIESMDIVYYTAIFLLPGFFMRRIIAMMIPVKRANDSTVFLSCLMYSIINLAVWSWAYNLVTQLRDDSYINDWAYWVILVIVTIVGAMIISFTVGVFIQKGVIRRLGSKLKIKTIDPIDTAWDWLFLKSEPLIVKITLKDDTEICGWYAEDSFASSDASERDIYIQSVYKTDENGEHQIDPDSRGIYIFGDSIKHIKLIQPTEVQYERQKHNKQ